MRRLSLAVAMLLSLAITPAFANGFGGFGGDSPPARIPVPAKPFSATLTDKGGTHVSVDKATFDGEIFFFGTLGDGQATVPFDRVSTARIEPHDDAGKVVLFIVLKDERTVRLIADADTPCYGTTTWGNYRIDLEKLQTISFP